MARHAKNPTTHLGLLRRLWPFTRRRASPLDRLRPVPAYPKWPGACRAVGLAEVPDLPERPLLTLAGEYRAGCWT
jgi:hypothetical protein